MVQKTKRMAYGMDFASEIAKQIDGEIGGQLVEGMLCDRKKLEREIDVVQVGECFCNTLLSILPGFDAVGIGVVERLGEFRIPNIVSVILDIGYSGGELTSRERAKWQTSEVRQATVRRIFSLLIACMEEETVLAGDLTIIADLLKEVRALQGRPPSVRPVPVKEIPVTMEARWVMILTRPANISALSVTLENVPAEERQNLLLKIMEASSKLKTALDPTEFRKLLDRELTRFRTEAKAN